MRLCLSVVKLGSSRALVAKCWSPGSPKRCWILSGDCSRCLTRNNTEIEAVCCSPWGSAVTAWKQQGKMCQLYRERKREKLLEQEGNATGVGVRRWAQDNEAAAVWWCCSAACGADWGITERGELAGLRYGGPQQNEGVCLASLR